jgi:hypothetical protein
MLHVSICVFAEGRHWPDDKIMGNKKPATHLDSRLLFCKSSEQAHISRRRIRVRLLALLIKGNACHLKHGQRYIPNEGRIFHARR